MKIKIGNMKIWTIVYALSLFLPIYIAQNTSEKLDSNVLKSKKEFIQLKDVSLSEEHYDSNGERVIRTVGISSRLLDRIHSMNCVGIHELALDILETNRHNQNLLIHNLRKFISQRNAEDVSNIQVQDLIPSPNLKLPSHQKTQQIRKSNLQKNILGEERVHAPKEIASSLQKKQSNSGQFHHFSQVKDLNRNDKEDLDKTFLDKKRKSHIDTSKQYNASSINHTNFEQMNANVSFEHQEVKGGNKRIDPDKEFHLSNFQDTKPNDERLQTSFNQQLASKNKESIKIIRPGNIHVNSRRILEGRHNEEVKQNFKTQVNINPKKTSEEIIDQESKIIPLQENQKVIENKNQNVIQKHISHSNQTSKVYKDSERSRRENSRKISSANQGATSIENFLQRYPEIRRISSRFHNDSPQRVLNGHSQKMTKPSVTARTTSQNHVSSSTTQTVRAPSTKRVKSTNNSPRLPSQIDQDKRDVLLSTNNRAIPSKGNYPDFDNSYEELSSADYSYLYYQDYYDELVPPHHRFQQLKNTKGHQSKNSSIKSKQTLINSQKLKEEKNTKLSQETKNNSQKQGIHPRRPETSKAQGARNENKKREHHNRRNNPQKPKQLSKTEQHQSQNNLNGTYAEPITTQLQKNVREESNKFNGDGSTAVSVGPFGYIDKGDYFSDESVTGFPEIIDITYQGFVWAITIQYPKKEKKIHGGIHNILKDKVKEKRINLNGDYIIRVTGRASPYNINRLTFHTSNGKIYGPFGERQHKESVDFDENAPPGHALAYISGTINFGVPLRSIAFHWRPIE